MNYSSYENISAYDELTQEEWDEIIQNRESRAEDLLFYEENQQTAF
jgi:hypothetical protein